jgi:ankyrin repeat protein
MEGMYRSLIVQLLHKLPDLQRVLDATSKNDNYRSASYTWRVKALRDLLANAVKRLGNRKLTCFVDALDECNDDQVQDMVEYFENLGEHAAQVGSKLYICFSSRHYPHIMVQFGRRLTLEKQPGHERDLQRYVRNKLKARASKEVNDISDEILRKADGVFLWVVLVVKILNKEFKNGRIFAVRRRLQETPDGLSQLFRDLLRRDSEYMDDLRLSVQWILFSRRPLRLEEFYYALVSGLDPTPENLMKRHPESPTVDDMNHFVLSSSKGLAEVSKASENRTVLFIHESVRDYLLKDNGFRELWPELEGDFQSKSHEKLKQCCHSYIFTIEKAGSDLRHEGPDSSPPDAENMLRNLPFLDYATRHVLDHADSAAATMSQDEFIKDLDLGAWIKQWNICQEFKVRHYTENANLLYVLAKKNLARLIQTVRQNDPRIDIVGERYQYPLFAALANSHRDAVRALLYPPGQLPPPGKDVCENLEYGQGFRANEGQTPLAWASDRGYRGVVKLLLDTPGIKLDSRDRLGQTSLLYAAKKGHEAIVQLLVKKGADVESKDKYDRTALWWAAASGHDAIVQLLVRSGADVKSKDIHGRVPLPWAVANGHQAIVQLLVDRGADAKSKDSQGRTPLWSAAANGHRAIVQLLVQNGADVELKDGQGWKPLWWDAAHPSNEIVQLLSA